MTLTQEQQIQMIAYRGLISTLPKPPRHWLRTGGDYDEWAIQTGVITHQEFRELWTLWTLKATVIAHF